MNRPTSSQQVLLDYCRSLPTAMNDEDRQRIKDRIASERDRQRQSAALLARIEKPSEPDTPF